MGHVAVWGALQYGPQERGRVVYIVRRASWGCGVHYSCSLETIRAGFFVESRKTKNTLSNRKHGD
jgi:hypothetical protein